MLSKIASKSLKYNPTTFKTLRLFSASSINRDEPRRYPHDAPERDFINFPAPKAPVHAAKVRMGFIPNEWFETMYEKTGVTGPYLLFWGGLATLLSKEYYVWWVDSMEHLVALGFIIGISKKFGPMIAAYLDAEVAREEKAYQEQMAAATKNVDNQIDALKQNLTLVEANKLLHAAKRENVHLQLEAEYRKRLLDVFHQTKKRLDYQLAIQTAYARVEKEQMVNYVLNEVNTSIGDKQEKEVLQSCLAQLKDISVRHAGTI